MGLKPKRHPDEEPDANETGRWKRDGGNHSTHCGEDKKKIYTDHRYIRIKVPAFISVKYSCQSSKWPQGNHEEMEEDMHISFHIDWLLTAVAQGSYLHTNNCLLGQFESQRHPFL